MTCVLRNFDDELTAFPHQFEANFRPVIWKPRFKAHLPVLDPKPTESASEGLPCTARGRDVHPIFGITLIVIQVDKG
jgi:hypothetical protein